MKKLYLPDSYNFRFVIAGILFLWTLVILASCEQKQTNPFQHEFVNGPYPWNGAPKDKSGDEFTFAVFSDLNGGERDRIFEVAVEQLNLLRPELTISVGDLIDGGTEDRDILKEQWDDFDRRASKSWSPVFRVGGNHDLTNIVMRNYWEERYGRRYYYFIYKNVLFLVLDSEDYEDERMQQIYLARAEAIKLLDSGKIEEAEQGEYFKMPERNTGTIRNDQIDYFVSVLESHPDVRWTFLFMHKPVWQKEGDGSLERLEQALASRPYTLFNGHFHKYSYTEKNNRDYIMLSTTGGSQSTTSNAAFDALTLVTVTDRNPVIATIKMAGIIDKTGVIPANGNDLCYQASLCAEGDE